MTKASKTRSALFTSIISLLLCVSMLVGTTFAWFTDVAETGLNQIIAGNLDVELLDADGETVDENTKLFEQPKLWEPGAVAFAQLQVANVGNLDLQASMSINYEDVNYIQDTKTGETYRLSDVLQYAVINATGVDTTDREAVLAAAKASDNKGSLNLYDFKFTLAPEETSELQTLVIYWEPSTDEVDNRYNVNNDKKTSDGEALAIELGVKVFATQVGGEDHEEDSFGPDYDLNAGWNGEVDTESPPVETVPPAEDGGEPTIPDVTVTATTVGTKTPIKATVRGTELAEGDKVTLTVKDSSAADANIQLDGAGLVYDVKVTNQDGTQLPATITLTVPASLNVTKVVHYGATTEELAFTPEVKSDVNTLTFNMTSYSPVVVYHNSNAMIGSVYYDDLAAALAAAADGDTVKLLAGNHTMPAVSNKTVTITGTKESVLTLPKHVSANATGSTITFDGITIVGYLNNSNSGDTYTQQLDGAVKAIYKNCTIQNLITTYCNSDFINCIFENTADNQYSVFIYGPENAEINFTSCTFNTACSKAIKLYNEGIPYMTVNVTDCTFNAATAKKAAVEIDSTYATLYTVNITNCKTNENYTKLWDGNTTKSEVYVDGLRLLSEGLYVDKAGVYFVSSAQGMVGFEKMVNEQNVTFNGKTVKLTADVDMTGIDWTPIGQTTAPQFMGTFDGQGHTISNLTVNTAAHLGEANYSTGLFGWLNAATVKNLTIDNADMTAVRRVGAIAGYLELGAAVENVTVINSTITCNHVGETNDNDDCGDKAGGVVGYMNADCKVTNCSVVNTAVSAGRDAGCVVGAGYNAAVTGCTFEDVTVTSSGNGCKGGNLNVDVIGRVLG